MGAFGGEVYRCVGNAGSGLEHLLHLTHAGAAVHTFDQQISAGGGYAVSGGLKGVNQRSAVDSTARLDIGPLGGQVDRYPVDTVNFAQRFFYSAHTRRAGQRFNWSAKRT